MNLLLQQLQKDKGCFGRMIFTRGEIKMCEIAMYNLVFITSLMN